jgi:hypothetical protein
LSYTVCCHAFVLRRKSSKKTTIVYELYHPSSGIVDSYYI